MSAISVLERGEEQMTDYQFKTILKMVLDIAEKTNSVEEIKESLKELIGERKEKGE